MWSLSIFSYSHSLVFISRWVSELLAPLLWFYPFKTAVTAVESFAFPFSSTSVFNYILKTLERSLLAANSIFKATTFYWESHGGLLFTHFSSFSPNTLLVLFFIFFFGYFDGKREEEGDIIDLKSLYCLECFFFCGQRIRCNLFDMHVIEWFKVLRCKDQGYSVI